MTPTFSLRLSVPDFSSALPRLSTQKDYVLSGYRIFGKVNCFQGGHLLSNKFLRKILKSEESYVLIEMNDVELTKKSDISQSIKIAVNA